ncbi:MAG: UDP-3-O-acyl-N-acetylglucosamine deacetylase [Alphaproteobacteria bacterium]
MFTLWQERQQDNGIEASSSFLSHEVSSLSSSSKKDCSTSSRIAKGSSSNVADLKSFYSPSKTTGAFNSGNRKVAYQQTVGDLIEIVGVGLHSGLEATLRVLPADANTGLQFKRVDQADAISLIGGRFDKVTDTQLCTKVSNDSNVSVGTVEHLLSALRAYEIDNAIIEIDGPEVPVLDGSSILICQSLDKVGVKVQTAPRQIIRILKPISVGDASCGATLYPNEGADKGFALDFTVKFDCAAIGEQNFKYAFDLNSYKTELAQARTFGFFEEVEYLRSKGLAKGGSLENAIVLKDGAVMNPEGLRYKDEFVRHKILDALGDLYLAGLQIEGVYVGVCAGHRINNELLRALFADPSAWTLTCQYQDTDVEVLEQAG